MTTEEKALSLGAVAKVRVFSMGMELLRTRSDLLPEGEHWLIPVSAHEAFVQRDGQIAELTEALEWYADNAAYCRILAPELSEQDPRTFAPVLQDKGTRARKALKGRTDD